MLKNNLELYVAGILTNKNVTKNIIYKNKKFISLEKAENIKEFIINYEV